MAEKWYEKIGLLSNPFEIDPLKEEKLTLFERDKETKEVIYRILSQNMLFIEGSKGSGKTALLKHAIDNFKGKGKVIYVDSNAVNKKLNIEKLLAGAKQNPAKEKYPKDMILLLDNVEQLSRLNNERIKYLFDQNYLKSVIFTGKNYNNAEFTESVRSRIGNRVMRIPLISEDGAISLVRERLGDNNNSLLTDEIIKDIYSRSGGDLKRFLMDMYLVCDIGLKGKHKTITMHTVDEALKKNPEKIRDFAETLKEEKKLSEQTRHCENCGSKLKKVGEYYRCKNCDTYCTECGALVEEEDMVCPECGANFD